MQRGNGGRKNSCDGFEIFERVCEYLHMNPELKAEIKHNVHWGLVKRNKDGSITDNLITPFVYRHEKNDFTVW